MTARADATAEATPHGRLPGLLLLVHLVAAFAVVLADEPAAAALPIASGLLVVAACALCALGAGAERRFGRAARSRAVVALERALRWSPWVALGLLGSLWIRASIVAGAWPRGDAWFGVQRVPALPELATLGLHVDVLTWALVATYLAAPLAPFFAGWCGTTARERSRSLALWLAGHVVLLVIGWYDVGNALSWYVEG